jgi:hypothetical protein
MRNDGNASKEEITAKKSRISKGKEGVLAFLLILIRLRGKILP